MVDDYVRRLRSARLALVTLDGELASELGPGYQHSERFRQLHDNTGEAPSVNEGRLMARYVALIAEGNKAIEDYEQQKSLH